MSTANEGAASIVGRAMRAFASGFAPVAIERLRAGKGSDWAKMMGFESTVGHGRSEVRKITDAKELLGLLREPAYDEMLRPVDGDTPRVRRAAVELDGIRDRWAHTEPIDVDDAITAVSMARTLFAAYAIADDDLLNLQAEAGQLASAGRPAGAGRADYLDALDRRVRKLDLGGISPAVDSTIVKGDLAAVFVEPRVTVSERRRGDRTTAVADMAFGTSGTSETRRRVDLDELLKQRRLILLGPPGAGKSTLLRVVARRFAFEGAEGQEALPVIMRAATYADALEHAPGLSFRRFITQGLSERFGPLFAAGIEDGSAALLVDGLDEVADDTRRRLVADRVLEFALDYPDVRVWATSRPYGYRPGRFAGHFDEARIGELDEAKIGELVHRWDVMLERDRLADDGTPASGLLDDLEANRGLWELASNPLLLTILYLLSIRGGRLPSRKVEVYAVATDTLLREWPAHRLQQRFDPAAFREVLERLALRMVEHGGAAIPEADVLTQLVEHFEANDGLDRGAARQRAREVLRVVEEHTGVFVEVGREADERRYGFLHRTFAEYLAARALAEHWEAGSLDWDALLRNPGMAETRDLFVGHIASGGRARATRLLREMRGQYRPIQVLAHADLRVVLDALAGGAQVEPSFRDEVVSEALDRLISPRANPVTAQPLIDSLATAARSGALGAIDRQLAAQSEDDADGSRRKALVWAALDPTDEPRIARAAHALDVKDLPDVDQMVVLGIIGQLALPEGTDEGAAFVSVVLDRPLDVVTGGSLAKAGWPHVDPPAFESVRKTVTWCPMLIDLRRWYPTLEEFIETARHWRTPARWIVPAAEWHQAHASEIGALSAHPEELPPVVAETAAWLAKRVGAEDIWEPVLRAIAIGGSRESRSIALDAYVERDSEGFEAIGAAALNDPDPAIRYRAIQPAWEVPYHEGNRAWLIRAARQLLESEEVEWVRGGALRALVHLDESAKPFSHIGDSTLYTFPPEGLGSVEPTRSLIARMALAVTPSADEHELTAVIDAAVRLVEANPSPADYAETLDETGDGPAHVLPEIALRCIASARPLTRLSGLALLDVGAFMPERATAIARLMADGDPDVRLVAALSLEDRDLEDQSVLADVVTAVLVHGPPLAAAHVAETTANSIRDRRSYDDILTLLDAFLESEPTSENASWFALMLPS